MGKIERVEVPPEDRERLERLVRDRNTPQKKQIVVYPNREDIMAKQNHGIVQDERGQDQPASKKAAHRTEPTVPKDAYELDPRDIRDGVYDPANDEGEPQPDQVPLNTTPHEAVQPGADARPEPDLSRPEPSLPEGLRRPRTGPYGPTKGRA